MPQSVATRKAKNRLRTLERQAPTQAERDEAWIPGDWPDGMPRVGDTEKLGRHNWRSRNKNLSKPILRTDRQVPYYTENYVEMLKESL